MRSEPSPNAIPIYIARQAIINLWDEKKIIKKGLLTDEMIEYIQKTTLDYTISARSLNELAHHFRSVNIPISEEIIKQFLQKLGNLVEKINEYIDQKIQPLIRTVESDETFKGMKIKFFEAIDHESGYLLMLQLIESTDYETLYPCFVDLKDHFQYIKRIITDLAKVYPSIIDDVFDDITHQLCQVHAIRNVFKDMRGEKSNFTKHLKKIKELKEQLDSVKTRRNDNLKAKSYQKKKLSQLELKRNQRRNHYGVVPYQKNILTLYPELRNINIEINSTKSDIRGKLQSEKGSKLKLELIKIELTNNIEDKNSAWSNYMICRKTLQNLIDFFKNKITSENEIISKIESLTQNYCKDFGKKIIKFIRNNPRLTTFHRYIENEESFIKLISTNKIESFNGRLKKFKEIRRKWVDSDLTKGVLEILRLHFNFNRTLSNRGRNKSPLEKLGFNLEGKILYDVIFHRLFSINIPLEKTPFQLSTSGGVVSVI